MNYNAFCVHAHFYQPPREDPFTGKIPVEPGAAPYPNWNERIYQQCYKPNAELGNFSRISFNIGPTLAKWLEEFHPETLNRIIEQENEVYRKYGVSNGMAQSYNHTILPLATPEDKITQIRWGIGDFEHRFGHKPSGMWMPETAADLKTLQAMADEGISFTIMAPWQAKKNAVDVTHPYLVELPNGKSITVFFYNADLSMQVSFNPKATVNADGFMYEYLRPCYPVKSRRPRLNIIASDGELYGHHQPFRDRFLEWLTTGALEKANIELTFPALWLRDHPAVKTIKIYDDTSWSCHHGIKRWCGVCECAEDGEWKAPMRRIFNRIAAYTDEEMQKRLDPYGLNLQDFRDEYIHVLTGDETAEAQLHRLIAADLSEKEEQDLLTFMRAQYERQRMFTSCGWFFWDFERIEARNNLAYAAMAVLLAEPVTGDSYEQKQVYRALTQVRMQASGVRASTIFKNAYDRK